MSLKTNPNAAQSIWNYLVITLTLGVILFCLVLTGIGFKQVFNPPENVVKSDRRIPPDISMEMTEDGHDSTFIYRERKNWK